MNQKYAVFIVLESTIMYLVVANDYSDKLTNTMNTANLLLFDELLCFHFCF